jgi:hypothetical protein
VSRWRGRERLAFRDWGRCGGIIGIASTGAEIGAVASSWMKSLDVIPLVSL